jgi:hypothetical protein
MTIPSIRSIATVSLDAAREGDYKAEFKLIKAECVELCYKALEQLSGFSVPDSVPMDKNILHYKSSASSVGFKRPRPEILHVFC